MDESTRGQNIKTRKGMTDIKIRIVVDSREGRREGGAGEEYGEEFQCLCNVFLHKIISR